MAKQILSRRRSLLLVGILVLIIAITSIVIRMNRTNTGSLTIPSTSPETSSESQTNGAAQNNGNATDQTKPSDKTIEAPSGTTELATPSGSFVSNYHISLAAIQESKLESVCVTSAGANCSITFTKDGIVKTLEAKKVGSNGAVTWYWSPKSAGITPGSWQVVAKAQLNGTTKSTTDLQNLEVSP